MTGKEDKQLFSSFSTATMNTLESHENELPFSLLFHILSLLFSQILSMHYTLAVTFTVDRLRALQNLIKKIDAEAQEWGIPDARIMDMRLTADMFSFSRQVQIASDNAKGMAGRLSWKEVPSFADDETTLQLLVERLEKTIDFLSSLSESDFAWAEEQEARFPWFPGVHMKGGSYLLSYAIPNFMFHITTAYAILRHHGFEIGKSDFLGTLPLIPDTK